MPSGENYDRDLGWPGVIAPGFYPFAVGTKTLVANTAYYARFVPSRDMRIDRIAFVVTTAAAAGDAVDVGIYDSDSLEQLVSSGALTGFLGAPATPQAVTFAPIALQPGKAYYAALSTDAAPALMAATWPSFGGVSLFSWGGSTFLQAAYESGNHPLPSTLGASTPASVPLLAVRES